jgi:hypothetical protein
MMVGMKRDGDEAEFYREIVRRAKAVRERAAESLRLSRLSRRGQASTGNRRASARSSRRKD